MLSASFFSCEKTLELDADTKTSKLVVNSLFNEKQEWRIEVSKSLSVLDEGNLEFIDNAVVNIFDKNNNLLEQIPYSFGYYESAIGLKPIAGENYNIAVAVPDFATVTAEDFCPREVPILTVDTSSATNSFGEKELVATIRFQDPAAEDNFYGLEVDLDVFQITYNNGTGVFDTAFIDREIAYLSSANPILDNGGADSYAQTLTFNDAVINGQSSSIRVSFSPGLEGSNYFYKKTARLISYSEATYNYIKSIDAYRNAEGNPFAEPVQVFSNIEKGFGIFGGRTISGFDF